MKNIFKSVKLKQKQLNARNPVNGQVRVADVSKRERIQQE